MQSLQRRIGRDTHDHMRQSYHHTPRTAATLMFASVTIFAAGCADHTGLHGGKLQLGTALRGSIGPGTTQKHAHDRIAHIANPALAQPTSISNVLAFKRTKIGCLPGDLKNVLERVATNYGKVTISSTHRNRRHNRRIGGASESMHLKCRAIDFRVHGPPRGLLSFLRRQPGVGGLKRYRSGFYHIDNGERRSW